MTMRGGTSRVDITPEGPVPLGGYAARAQHSTGVHDKLFARALVLDDGSQRLAIVACDLLGLEPTAARRVRRRIEAETGIPPSHTMIACSHTHSGPLVAPRRFAEVPTEYVAELEDRLVRVASEAAAGLAPIHLGVGRAKVHLGVNRRERTPEGTIRLGRNPGGPASPAAHVVLIASETGAPAAVLFTCGAHPVVLGPENLEVSGDYAGHAEREVEANFGGRAVALFALGFAGNVNADFQARSFEEVETVGTALARAVLETLKGIEPMPAPTLAARSARVALPVQPLPPLPEAERQLYQERDRLSQAMARQEDEAALRARRLAVDWASEIVRRVRQRSQESAVELEVQVLRLGEAVLVGLSAEVFTEYGAWLAEISPFPHTVPISVANGAIGYVPTAAAIEEGGYEVDGAPRFYGHPPFRPEVEGIVRQALAEQLAELAGVPVPATEAAPPQDTPAEPES